MLLVVHSVSDFCATTCLRMGGDAGTITQRRRREENSLTMSPTTRRLRTGLWGPRMIEISSKMMGVAPLVIPLLLLTFSYCSARNTVQYLTMLVLYVPS